MWLVCAATEFELATWPDEWPGDCARVVSGVGIPATFSGLGTALASGKYSLIVNIGIAGAYPSSGLSIGDIVIADGEVYGDMGFELPDDPGFQSLISSPFGAFYQHPFPTVQPEELQNPPVPFLRGATVNTCTGTDATGALRAQQTGAAFETMEGAAVAQLGQQFGVPVCEIRAISNIAARRDMRPENIRLAIGKLREYLAVCVRTRI